MIHLEETGGNDLMVHRGIWVYNEVWEKVVAFQRSVPGVKVNRLWNEAMLNHLSEIEDANDVFRLEVEVDLLVGKLDRVHRDGKALLRHGSYASAYVKELKGQDVRRVVSDLPPYNSRNTRPALTERELSLVEKMVVFRRAIAEELWEKLDRLMDLKCEDLDPGLVNRVRQSLKVSDMPGHSSRVPGGVDELVMLPPGKGRRSPEELYRRRARSGDHVIDEVLSRARVKALSECAQISDTETSVEGEEA